MAKYYKTILAVCLLLSIFIFSFMPAITQQQAKLEKAASSAGYSREEVKTALLRYEQTGTHNEISKKVLQKTSFGIATPNLAPEKVRNDTPLAEYGNREDFYAALRAHGYDAPDMASMPYWQYEQLEDSWLLDKTTAESLTYYPELADRDISRWTYGMYRQFMEQCSKENLAARFTAEQLAELEARSIQIADTQALLKIYYQPEVLLAQSDATLRAVLEDYYETKLTLSLGADWRTSARKA